MILYHPGLFWIILAHFGLFWCILIQFKLLWKKKKKQTIATIALQFINEFQTFHLTLITRNQTCERIGISTCEKCWPWKFENHHESHANNAENNNIITILFYLTYIWAMLLNALCVFNVVSLICCTATTVVIVLAMVRYFNTILN